LAQTPLLPELTVRSGHVIALRLFALANEIDLGRAEQLWARRVHRASTRSKLTATPTKAVSFGVPPLALAFEPIAVTVGGVAMTAVAGVRLYDFGIAALTLRLPARDLGWAEFTRLVNDTNGAVGPAIATAVWDDMLAQLRDLLGEALDRPTAAPLQEDYLIALIDAFNEPVTADALLARADLAPLLSGQVRPLSEGARGDLLRHRFSYFPDDLVVITWDRAFIYEPQQETDVADVLEMANAQLLEMRVYDEMLDDELPRMHDLVESARRRMAVIASRRYARLARRLHSLVAEVTVLAERVDNALQVTEDVYLARVYAAAMELFRVPNVTQAVDRKLAIIREIYTALQSDAAGARAELLEIAVMVLIFIEILLSVLRHG
jgi:hypothetical protein